MRTLIDEMHFTVSVLMSAPSRVGSASSKCVTQSELWTLRDTVLQLQEDLLQSRAQLNRTVGQFDSLVDLVRK